MSHIVAIAGGTGALGRPMVEALTAEGKHQVFVLSRNVNPEFEKATGAKTLATDYTNVASLVQLLETHKIDTVIATFGVASPPSNELNLVDAAEQSTTTKRYIPNSFSLVPFTDKHAATSPLVANMVNMNKKLQTTKLEWSIVRPGLFLDYYVKGPASYVAPPGMIVDIKNHVASLPGTGDTPVPMTHTFDIGKYIAALVGASQWERYYYIQGDKPSFKKVIAVVEKALGVKFKVTYDSVESLRKGEMATMPMFEELAAHFGGGEQGMKFVKGLMANNSLWIEEGDVDYKGPFLNEKFPEIKALTLEEGWKSGA